MGERGTEQFEDKVKLLLYRGAREQGPTRRHLIEDTANTPANIKTHLTASLHRRKQYFFQYGFSWFSAFK